MAFLCDLAHSFTTNAKQDEMFILILMLYCTSKSCEIQVTKVANKQQFSCQEKKLVALATVLVVISSPVKGFCHGFEQIVEQPKYTSLSRKLKNNSTVLLTIFAFLEH